MTNGKTIALTRRTLVGKVISLLLNILSRLVLTFLPRSKRLLISWLQSPSAVTQSCPTLCDPLDYTGHGILQARILEWVAFPFFRGSSQPWDWTQVSRIAGGLVTSLGTREAPAGRNINNLRYADDTTLMAEREEELKASWWKWKRRVKKLA